MTLYEYECSKHGKFEIRRSMSDNGETFCPNCGNPAKRVLSMPAIIYKADGFYSIDSGKRFESQLTPRGKEIYNKAKAEHAI